MRKPLCLRPLYPKLPNPRLSLAPTPPGPSLKPAPQSSAAARPRPQPLAPYPETPPPADPVLRNQAPPLSMARCPKLPNPALSPHPGACRTRPQLHLAVYPAQPRCAPNPLSGSFSCFQGLVPRLAPGRLCQALPQLRPFWAPGLTPVKLLVSALPYL